MPALPDPLPQESASPAAVMPMPVRNLRIGRAPDNDLVLDDLLVSRYHAELRKRPDGGFEIADLGSQNGTFVNGRRIATQPLTDSDTVGIGHSTFRLSGSGLEQFVDDGAVTVAAQELVVTVAGGKVLLDRVSFAMPEKCLVGVDRPERRGQVDAPRRDDRDAARGHGHRGVRQQGPLRGLRRAQAPHRPGAAGKHPAYPADRPPCAAVLGGAALSHRHHGRRARRAGHRGDGRARPGQARGDARRPAVRRAAQADERRPGTADPAVAAVPRRAHLRPRSRPGQVGHVPVARPRPRWPDDHRGHAQRPEPHGLRPAARPRPRREDGLLRAAGRGARLLRAARLGGPVPGVRPLPRPRLGGRVRRVPRPRALRGGAAPAERGTSRTRSSWRWPRRRSVAAGCGSTPR